jgi:hypothetical protein
MQANRDKLFSQTALMINAEHTSQVLTHDGVEGLTETVIPQEWYAGGAQRPELAAIAADAFRRFGVPIWAEPSDSPPGGDLGVFYGFLPGVVAQANDFQHMHTSDDTPAHVSWAGLQALTRAYARIVDDVNQLELSALQRPPEESEIRAAPFDLSLCPAWLEDSAAKCDYPADGMGTEAARSTATN